MVPTNGSWHGIGVVFCTNFSSFLDFILMSLGWIFSTRAALVAPLVPFVWAGRCPARGKKNMYYAKMVPTNGSMAPQSASQWEAIQKKMKQLVIGNPAFSENGLISPNPSGGPSSKLYIYIYL